MKKKQKKRKCQVEDPETLVTQPSKKNKSSPHLKCPSQKDSLDLSQGRISNESKHGKFFSATAHSLESSEKEGGEEYEQEKEELVVDSD